MCTSVIIIQLLLSCASCDVCHFLSVFVVYLSSAISSSFYAPVNLKICDNKMSELQVFINLHCSVVMQILVLISKYPTCSAVLTAT